MQAITPLESEYLLVGAVIRLAVRDSFSPYKNIKADARDFIFTSRIENFLFRFHLIGSVNIEMLRKYITDGHGVSAHSKIQYLFED